MLLREQFGEGWDGLIKDMVVDFHIRSRKDRKKNEQIKQMVEKIKALKSRYGVPVVALVAMVRLSLASYMLWNRRILDGWDPVQKPGAKKRPPIDLRALKQRIDELTHGKERSRGTGQLYRANRHGISSREFNKMDRDVRCDTNRRKRASLCKVVWALDGLEYENCHIQNLQDLCSR